MTSPSRTMQVIYARIMEIHRRIEALYPRVEDRAAYFRTFMRADSALPKASGKPMGVRVDPIVCALAIKAATTKQAIAALCELGHGDDAFALTRVLMENACLLEWLIRGDGHRRLDTYALFTSVMHERIVAIVERFRDRFIAAGADLQVKSDPYHRAIAEHVFGDPRDDRPTRELSDKGTLIPVSIRKMFEAITDTAYSYEHAVLYGAIGSDIVHSGPFSLARTTEALQQRSTFMLQPMPAAGHSTLALAMSNSAMLLILDSLNEFVGLGLSDDLAALKVENQKDPSEDAHGEASMRATK